MEREKLLDNRKILSGYAVEEDIKGICKDSRDVQPGDMFFDLSDSYEEGIKHCKEALQNGASFIVSENRYPLQNIGVVADVHEAFAEVCSKFYGEPSKSLKLIGITGTNGKTTCAHIISEGLKSLGKKVATVGTMGINFDGQSEDVYMTTPDADILHRKFAEMKKAGVEYVVMEVSAHALAQKRVHGLNFDVGVLTNITQDHLDYFGSMENYKNCKLSFLDPKYVKSAVICVDDESGMEFVDKCKAPCITYGIKNPADVFAINLDQNATRTKFCCNLMDDIYDVETNLVGEYNVLNTLASMSVCADLGLDMRKVVESLKYIHPVEGRFNIINYNGKHIVIDFAHTPDGLEKVLSTAKDICKGKLYCIFGCGGNRDKDKRHKMGAISEKYCDGVCISNDNPRFEDPMAIARDIEVGMKKKHFVELDRQKAIKKMIDLCQKDDVLVIAGKGGERYQIFGDEKVDYNDFDAVYKCISKEKEDLKREKYGS